MECKPLFQFQTLKEKHIKLKIHYDQSDRNRSKDQKGTQLRSNY